MACLAVGDQFLGGVDQLGTTETNPEGHVMDTATNTCWADPLNRKERAELARRLARACQRFYDIPAATANAMYSQIVASAEMADLHLDVTERAEVPGR